MIIMDCVLVIMINDGRKFQTIVNMEIIIHSVHKYIYLQESKDHSKSICLAIATDILSKQIKFWFVRILSLRAS